MRIGDYVTVDEIKRQRVCRWVVLAEIQEDVYGGVEGGVIQFIEDTKTEAGDKEAGLHAEGMDTILICGATEPLSMGGVFVE
jgi:hypothetical protein